MTQVELPRRLSAMDAMWLAQEDATQRMHGTSFLIYEGHISRDELLGLLEDRLALLPRFRQKVVYPPFGIARPSWEEDPQFDLNNHVKELNLPPDADDRALAEVAARVHMPPLDRNRPLWEMTVLRGRSDGSTVVCLKLHHAMVDGPSLIDILPLLHDAVPHEARPTVVSAPTNPDPIAQLQDAVRDRLTEVVQLGTDLAFRSLRPEVALEQSQRMVRALAQLSPDMLKQPPKMPWNGPLSPDRRVAWGEVPFATIQGIREALGGTVNDVALAVLAGALGRYLRQHGQQVEGMQLRDMVTTSVRRPEERGTLGNRVAAMMVPLYVGIEDPVERLRAQREAMDRVKEQGMAGLMDEMSGVADLIPPVVWLMASMPRPTMPARPELPNLCPGLPGVPGMPSPNPAEPVLINIASANIRGPQRPLHLGGHVLLNWHTAGMLGMNVGLFLVILTYNNKFVFSMTVDPKRVPDEWSLIDHFEATIGDMREAAERARALSSS
jgi:WS/DGAT/MGAT family acyltransferase